MSSFMSPFMSAVAVARQNRIGAAVAPVAVARQDRIGAVAVARQDWIGAAAIIAIIAASICWRRATTNPHVLRGGCRRQGSSQQQDQDDRDCQLESFPMKH